MKNDSVKFKIVGRKEYLTLFSICRINLNSVKNGIPYLFDICKPE